MAIDANTPWADLPKQTGTKPNGAGKTDQLDEADFAELKVKHRDLTTDLKRLADIKSKADAGEIAHAVFEAERFDLAEK